MLSPWRSLDEDLSVGHLLRRDFTMNDDRTGRNSSVRLGAIASKEVEGGDQRSVPSDHAVSMAFAS